MTPEENRDVPVDVRRHGPRPSTADAARGRAVEGSSPPDAAGPRRAEGSPGQGRERARPPQAGRPERLKFERQPGRGRSQEPIENIRSPLQGPAFVVLPTPRGAPWSPVIAAAGAADHRAPGSTAGANASAPSTPRGPGAAGAGYSGGSSRPGRLAARMSRAA